MDQDFGSSDVLLGDRERERRCNLCFVWSDYQFLLSSMPPHIALHFAAAQAVLPIIIAIQDPSYESSESWESSARIPSI